MGKKIYLVKQASQERKSRAEWQQMSGKEFHSFLKTGNSAGRYFICLRDDVSYEGDIIYMETSEASYRSWRREYDAHHYLARQERAVQILSLDAPVGEDGITLGDLTQDQGDQPEEQLLRRDQMSTLRRALKGLTQEERFFIGQMFLSERQKTEVEMAAILGISRDAVHRRKKKLLEQLRRSCEGES